MTSAAGFEFGPDGYLYVVDFNGDKVLRYDGTDGSYVDEFMPSSSPNQPINLTFAPAQQVLVTFANGEPSGLDASITTDEDVPYTLRDTDFGFSDMLDSDGFAGVVITTAPTAGTLRNGASVLSDGDFVSAIAIAAGDLVYHPRARCQRHSLRELHLPGAGRQRRAGSRHGSDPQHHHHRRCAGLNDAPVLVPASPTLTSITEDDLTNAGDLVSDLLGSSVTDADGASSKASRSRRSPAAMAAGSTRSTAARVGARCR